jgi:hypothetical protein
VSLAPHGIAQGIARPNACAPSPPPHAAQQVGKLADMIIIDANPVKVSPPKIRDVKVRPPPAHK